MTHDHLYTNEKVEFRTDMKKNQNDSWYVWTNYKYLYIAADSPPPSKVQLIDSTM
jgi:hypothetical protein